jgi:hypothetical protein
MQVGYHKIEWITLDNNQSKWDDHSFWHVIWQLLVANFLWVELFPFSHGFGHEKGSQQCRRADHFPIALASDR